MYSVVHKGVQLHTFFWNNSSSSIPFPQCLSRSQKISAFALNVSLSLPFLLPLLSLAVLVILTLLILIPRSFPLTDGKISLSQDGCFEVQDLGFFSLSHSDLLSSTSVKGRFLFTLAWPKGIVGSFKTRSATMA